MSFTMKFWNILLAVSALSINSACAQETTGLTEESIRQFSHDTATASQKPYAEYLDFIKTTTNTDFHGQVSMNIHMPDNTIEKSPKPMDLDRTAMVSTAQVAYDSIQNATIEIIIHDIKISPDKKSAIVTSDVIVTNQEIITGEPPKVASANSKATCTDEVVFTAGIGVQLMKSNCTTELTMNPLQEL